MGTESAQSQIPTQSHPPPPPPLSIPLARKGSLLFRFEHSRRSCKCLALWFTCFVYGVSHFCPQYPHAVADEDWQNVGNSDIERLPSKE